MNQSDKYFEVVVDQFSDKSIDLNILTLFQQQTLHGSV